MVEYRPNFMPNFYTTPTLWHKHTPRARETRHYFFFCRVCAPSSVPVSPLRTSLVGEGKSGLPPAGPVPPASEGGDGVENNDILRVRP